MNNEFEDIFNSSKPSNINTINNTPIEEPKKKKISFDFNIKNDKVLFIQLILFGVWAILTVIIYFFGYDLFEPFIKI